MDSNTTIQKVARGLYGKVYESLSKEEQTTVLDVLNNHNCDPHYSDLFKRAMKNY